MDSSSSRDGSLSNSATPGLGRIVAAGHSVPDNCSELRPGLQQGVVLSVNGRTADLIMEMDRCQGCGHSGTCSLFMNGTTSYTMKARLEHDVSPGDKVLVALSAERKVKTACLLYLCPSISTLLGGYTGAYWLSDAIGVPQSVGGLLAVLVLLPLGLLPAYIANKLGTHLPVVKETLKED